MVRFPQLAQSASATGQIASSASSDTICRAEGAGLTMVLLRYAAVSTQSACLN